MSKTYEVVGLRKYSIMDLCVEHFLKCLPNEILADILIYFNSEFCLVKDMVNWKKESFIDAILEAMNEHN